ncbi:MAG: NAD-dependent epimerase/dehydratase family protein [Syntrophorhabdaceae bacterium]
MDKLKVGIAGCGTIFHYHRAFIESYPDAVLCGIADKDEKALKKMSEMYGIRNCYWDIEEMIEKQATDVVHITTPPQTHAALAEAAINRGNHVFIEKPMTLDAATGAKIYDMAAKNDVRVCVDHNHLFDPWMLQAKDVLKDLDPNGITYVESYYGINPNIPEIMGYRKANTISWMYSLPGGLFHHFLTHPLYLMLEYTGRAVQIETMARSNGAFFQDMSDELHIMVNGERAIGKLTVSFNAKPFQHFVKIYHKKAIITIDFNNMNMAAIRHMGLPAAVTKIATNFGTAKAFTTQTISNVYRFVTGKPNPYSGMRKIIHAFYDSIRHASDLPVSRDNALNVLEVMDDVWRRAGKLHPVFRNVVATTAPTWVPKKGRVLVTGAGGFLGSRLTEMLLEKGYFVRVLVRKLTNIEPFKRLGADIHYGDVRDEMALAQAIDGMDYVVHAAAAQDGDWEDLNATTVQGTEKVMWLSRQLKVKRVIYISSMSVYQMSGLRRGSHINEESVLEKNPEARGFYTYSKLEADKMARSLMGVNGNGKVPAVILRPATIYGPRGPVFIPLVAISVFNKVFVMLGKQKMKLPLVYIDNLADAIIICIENDSASGCIFNVVDDDSTIKKGHLKKLAAELFPSSYAVTLPCWLVKSVVNFQERAFKIMKRVPFLTHYRLASASANVNFSNEKIKEYIHWSPRISLDEGVERTLQWFRENR